MKLKCEQGFSLTEMVITITFISILSNFSYFIIGNISEKSHKVAAIAKAHTLNSAKISYKISTKNAQFEFDNITSEEDKFQALRNYIPMSDASLSNFSIRGYTYSLGKLEERVEILDNFQKIVLY